MPADLDVSLLRTFWTLSSLKSFTLAAKQLNRTQSTVSLHLRKLENILEKQLVDRSSRHFALTQEGESLRGYAGQLLALHDEARHRLTMPAVSGKIRIGVPEDFATTQLPDVLRRFASAYPSVTLEVRCAVAGEPVAFRRSLFTFDCK